MRFVSPELAARFRSRLGRRASGVVLALAVETLIALLLLTLAPRLEQPRDETAPLVAFFTDNASESDEPPAPEKQEEDEPSQENRQRPEEEREAPRATRPQPASPEMAAPEPPTRPPWIELSSDEMASSDLARPTPPAAKPAAPGKPAKVYGPPADPRYSIAANDTPRVPGSGPHGEPLYAASWYREPRDDELRGFLSAAKSAGWGLIACKTAPHYRVVDCVKVAEYPEHSGIAQAVLAAAYQFEVRPPRIGGQPQVGEWVRIRIDYSRR